MLKISQILLRIMLYILIFASTCCGGYTSPQSTPLPTYCQPELPFLLAQPYNRLYVEVDTTEGTKIPDGILDELKEFMSKYCRKPEGIEIVIDDVIPQSEYKPGFPI